VPIVLTSDIGGAVALILVFMLLASPWIAGGAVIGWLATVRIGQPLLAAFVGFIVSTVSFWATLSATFIILADNGLESAGVIMVFAAIAIVLALPWYVLEAVLIWAHKRSGASLWSEPPVEPWRVVAKR
jgi:hypothetical protein